MIRCTLLADNTTDELPKETDQIEDAIDGQKIAPLSETEQEQMNALHTFRPTTVLSNDADCEMELTYYG